MRQTRNRERKEDAASVQAVSAENGTATAAFQFFATEEGLYLFASVTDGTVSSAGGGVYADDCVQFNIAASDELSASSLPGDFFTKSRSLTVSASGQVRMTYLNKEGYLFAGGFDCTNYGDVSGVNYVGGIVGDAQTDGAYVSGCENHGDVTGEEYVGGVAGMVYDTAGQFADNASDGEVTGTGDYVGDLIGADAFAGAAA